MCSSSVNAKISFIALIAIGIIIRDIDAKPPLKIRGGEDAAPNEFPWLARLNITSMDMSGDCGGAIISPRHILTAAHCLDDVHVSSVWTGFHIRDFNLAVGSNPAQVIVHPNYTFYELGDSEYAENDVGIITLDRDLELGANQNVILLADKNTSAGTRAVLAGWGTTDQSMGRPPMILQKTSIFITSDDQCPGLTPNQLCGWSPPHETPCHGDSGGPLVVDGRVVGILSTGSCVVGGESVYTDIYHYLTWIRSVVEQIPV